MSTTTGWQTLPCPACGMDHRADCPERFSRGVAEPCRCGIGCRECDWTGTRMWTTGGHRKWRRLASQRTHQPTITAE